MLLVGGAFGLWLILIVKTDNKGTPLAEKQIQPVQAAIPQQMPIIPGKGVGITNALPRNAIQTGVSPKKFTPSQADLQETAKLEKEFVKCSATRRFRNIESAFAPQGKPTSLPTYLANSKILDWKIQSILNDVTGKKEYLEVVVLKTRDGSDYRLERAAIGPSQSGNLPWTEMMGNELLVTLNTQNVPPGFIEDKGIRIEFLKTEGLKDTYQIRFRSENAESLPKAYDLFESKMKQFRNLQPQFIYHACATPTDPGYASSSANRWHLEKVGMPAVWDKIQNTDVTVAVLDTGVNYNHEDLKDNIYTFPDGTHGWDFENNNAYPLDTGYTKNGSLIYHGSHCAGIIGMRGNNNFGSVGACHRIKVLPLRLGSDSISSRVKQALIFCSTSSANVQIASMSFSTSSGPDSDMQTLEAFTDYFNNGRRIGVISSGNNTNNIDTGVKVWPASFNYSYLVKVAASTSNDSIASFSNYGSSSVDLAAPGVEVYSVDGATTDGYRTMDGTSMSTPLVAGALALLRAAAPQKTAAELIACLNANVDKSSTWTALVKSGGRLNVDKALKALNFVNTAPYFESATKDLKPVKIPNRDFTHVVGYYDSESNPLVTSYSLVTPTDSPYVNLVQNSNGLFAFKYLNDGDYTLKLSADDGYITTEKTLNVRAGGSYLSDGWKASYYCPAVTYPTGNDTPVGKSTWATSHGVWGSGAPNGVIDSLNFSVDLEGYYVPLYSGTYQFYYAADGGRILWIDDDIKIYDLNDYIRSWWDPWGESLRYSTISVTLNKGQPYKIMAHYGNSVGYASLYLQVKGPYDTTFKDFIPSQYVTLPDVVITKTSPNTANTPFTISAVNQAGGFYSFIPSVFMPYWFKNSGPGNLTFSATTSSSTQVTASSPGAYSVGFWSLGYDRGSFYTTYDVMIYSALQQWSIDNFGSPAPTGVSGLTADYDGDGISNLVEYAVGTSPLSPNSSSISSATTSVNGLQYLSLNISRTSLRSDITYVVEVSNDLVSWYSGSSFTTIMSDTSTLLSVRDNTPMSSATKRFIRLKISSL